MSGQTSVYQYFTSGGKLLYVGVTARGVRRAKEHASSKEWWPLARGCTLEHYDTRGAALNRERDLIVAHCPPFNTVHSPDRSRAEAEANELLWGVQPATNAPAAVLTEEQERILDEFELTMFPADLKARRTAYYKLPHAARAAAPCIVCFKEVTGKRDGPSCSACHSAASAQGLNSKRRPQDGDGDTAKVTVALSQQRSDGMPERTSYAGSTLRANYSEPIELRATASDDGTTMFGHFSVFNAWYEINSVYEGRFLERVVRGAFDETFTRNRERIRVLYDHGMDPSLGNKPLGPIDVLTEDERGAFYEVPLLDTDYNRDFVLPALRGRLMNGESRGSQLGASFRFMVRGDEWNESPKRSNHNPDGIPERTIESVDVFEFGPVTFGASPTATSGVRGITDEFMNRLETDPMFVARLTERAGLGVVERILSQARVADRASERKTGGVADQPTSTQASSRASVASALTTLTALKGAK